jgi:hypothetical protein
MRGPDRRKVERFVGEGEVTDERVVQRLEVGAAELDVVGRPAHPEVLAAGRQLTGEIGEAAVVGVAAGLGAQDGGSVVGDARQSAKKPPARGVKKMNRAMVAGRTGPANTSGESAVPSRLAGRIAAVPGTPRPPVG